MSEWKAVVMSRQLKYASTKEYFNREFTSHIASLKNAAKRVIELKEELPQGSRSVFTIIADYIRQKAENVNVPHLVSTIQRSSSNLAEVVANEGKTAGLIPDSASDAASMAAQAVTGLDIQPTLDPWKLTSSYGTSTLAHAIAGLLNTLFVIYNISTVNEQIIALILTYMFNKFSPIVVKGLNEAYNALIQFANPDAMTYKEAHEACNASGFDHAKFGLRRELVGQGYFNIKKDGIIPSCGHLAMTTNKCPGLLLKSQAGKDLGDQQKICEELFHSYKPSP